MDDTLITPDIVGINAGNILVRELLKIITDAGIRWSADDADQLSAVVHGVCCDNEQMFYENEVVVCWL